jgi:5-hydroxyisourate hydrolase
MSKLTTHVLDVSAGVPAAGVRVELRTLQASTSLLLTVQYTGEDGRCPRPLLEAEQFQAGRYTLTFYVGEYFHSRGLELPQPPFIDEAVVHFGVAHPDQHYHVPLLVTPWSYSVYRGR